MKRRGFLGVMAGGAVAGPSMVKQAAAAAMQEAAILSPGGLASQVSAAAYMPDPLARAMNAQKSLAKLVGMTPAGRSRLKQRMRSHPDNLDPDIETYKSFSMSFKLDMQAERNLQSHINSQKTILQRIVEGLSPYDVDDEDIPW